MGLQALGQEPKALDRTNIESRESSIREVWQRNALQVPKEATWWLRAESQCALCPTGESFLIWRDVHGQFGVRVWNPYLLGIQEQGEALAEAFPGWDGSQGAAAVLAIRLDEKVANLPGLNLEDGFRRLSKMNLPIFPEDPMDPKAYVDGMFVAVEIGSKDSNTAEYRWRSSPAGHEALEVWVHSIYTKLASKWESDQERGGFPALVQSQAFRPLSSDLLVAACLGQKSKLVVHLLKMGVPPNGTSRDGRLPLAAACETGDPSLVKFLLEGGADPKLPGVGGWMPLDAAVNARSAEIVRLLIDHGAPLNRTGHGDGTPLDRARSMGLKEIEGMLTRALKKP